MRTKFQKFKESYFLYSFKRDKVAIFSFIVLTIFLMLAATAPWVAPMDPYDAVNIDIMNSELPPVWMEEGSREFLLGTDNQGRDMLSAIMFGLQISLGVGFASVILAAIFGTILGLLSGYLGGWLDSFIMRVADVQLTFPAILIALMIDGIVGGKAIARKSSTLLTVKRVRSQ